MAKRHTRQKKAAYQSRASLQKQIEKLQAKVNSQNAFMVQDVDTTPAPRRQTRTMPQVDASNGIEQEPFSLLDLPLRPSAAHPGTAVIHVTPSVRELFSKRMRGLGGFQTLYRQIAARMDESNEVILNAADFARVVNYAANYGEGGFQSALRWLVTLWVNENLPQIYQHAAPSSRQSRQSANV